MSNPTFKPSEGKREEFRKYLEKGGVMDALTKVLVNLYEEPEKPEDALEYIRDRLAVQAGIETYAQMKVRLEEFQTRIDNLTLELEDLKATAMPPPGGERDEDAPPLEEGIEGDEPAKGSGSPRASAGQKAAEGEMDAPPPETELAEEETPE